MPRTLAQNAQYIAETIKPAIKSAIEAQGVTVPSTDSFLDYADRIGEIEGGGSGYQLKDLPSGAISTVNDAAPLPLNALKVSVEAWQEGSGDPSPNNIRPISGWSGCIITNLKDASQKSYFDGLLDGTFGAVELGTLTWTAGDTANTFYANLQGYKFNANVLMLCEDYTFEGTGYGTGALGNKPDKSCMAYYQAGQNYREIYFKNLSCSNASQFQSAINGVYLIYELATPSIPLTFSNYAIVASAFDGWAREVNFGQDIYGGSTNLLTGEGSKTHAKINPLDYQSAFQMRITATSGVYRMGFIVGDLKLSAVNEIDVISDTLKGTTPYGTYGQIMERVEYGISGDTSSRIINVFSSELQTVQSWIDFFTANPCEIVYRKITPSSFTFTPIPTTNTLEGTNNVYADCGEVIEGEYFVDEGAIDVRKVDYQIGASGSIKTIDGRVLSGFASMSGYHARPLDASGNWLDVDWSKDFEVCVAFKYTDSGASGITVLLGYNYNSTLNSRFQSPLIYIDKDHSRDLCLEISSNGSSWMVDQSLSYAIDLDTWYALRLKFTLSTLTLDCSISTDFDTWTSLYNNTLSAAPYHSNTSMIGIGSGCQASSWASNGLLIDTFNTYIKGDGVNWGASTGAFPS